MNIECQSDFVTVHRGVAVGRKLTAPPIKVNQTTIQFIVILRVCFVKYILRYFCVIHGNKIY